MKKIIVIVILILLAILFTLSGIILYNTNTNNSMENEDSSIVFSEEESEILENNFYKINYDNTSFYEIENFINKYCQENIDEFNIFFGKKMYFHSKIVEDTIGIYYVYGNIWSEEYSTKEFVLIQIEENYKNDNLEVVFQKTISEKEFQDYIYTKQIEFLKDYSEQTVETLEEDEGVGSEIEGELDDEDSNGGNVYYNEITNQYISQRLFKQFIIHSIYDTDAYYNFLTDDFKTSNFKKLKNFKQYINNNKEMILNSEVVKYKIVYDYNNSNAEMTCSIIDNHDIYYNFYIDSENKITVDFKNI